MFHVGRFRLFHAGRRALRRERVFRDRTKPLNIYDDFELIDKYRFDRQSIIMICDMLPGADQGFQVRGGGAHLKKLRRSEVGAKIVGGISCEKSRFYAKIIFDSKFTELIEVLYILYPVLNFTLKLQ